jgi:hypothetical protein
MIDFKNVVEDNQHLKNVDQCNYKHYFIICSIVGLSMIITGLYLWYNIKSKDNKVSDTISDTDSVISIISENESNFSDTTITPYNVNENNLPILNNAGELIFNSANKNHLGFKNSVTNLITYNGESIFLLHKKISGIKHLNYDLDIKENLSINESNRVLCNLNLLY